MSRIRLNVFLGKVTLYLVNIILSIGVIFPIFYALMISFMPQSDLFSSPPKIIPSALYFGNYPEVLNTVPIFRYILNSFLVSSIVTIILIIISSLSAYAFVYYDFKWKNTIFMLFLATMMIPGETVIIANYFLVARLHLLDTYLGLIIGGLPSVLGVFLMRQFFLSIPRDFYDAAQLDGCGKFNFLMKILLPLSRPAIGSLAIYSFLATWNQYMWPLLVTNSINMRTVQIGISALQFSEASNSYGLIMAGVVMVLAPSIIIFVIGQRQLIEGLTGGLKG
jgi:sn-glycerol 3-phosphate transport system permease protein